LFHIIRNENVRRVVPPIIAGILWQEMAFLSGVMPEIEDGYALVTNPGFAPVMFTFGIGCVAAAFLLKNYNGERGKRMKWLFYVIYPLHLAVLALVALVLGLINLSVLGL